jgi:Fur family ferric uptake transcriptional regulator
LTEIERALKGGGHRLTSPRRFVVWELERSRRPLSAEQLRGRIKREYPQVSLSTVYRTLKLLEKLGVAHRKSFGEGYSRYELRAGKPRHHALCLSCGAVIEFHEALLDYFALRLEREIGFFADSYELTLHGYCAACAAYEPTAAR